MTKIKICGLRRREDISYVNKLKPDYVGFVFAKSRRQVDKDKARGLIDGLDKSIKTVGVFLNAHLSKVKEISEYCNLDIIQLHGDESPEYCSLFNRKVWKAFRIKSKNSLKDMELYNTDGYLLDTYLQGAYGGTGEVFNWDIASEVSREKFIILAGGLSESNIDRALNIVKPAVVDVSSGVEIDGYKDFDRMKRFVERVKMIR